jgi:hypothetical protein
VGDDAPFREQESAFRLEECHRIVRQAITRIALGKLFACQDLVIGQPDDARDAVRRPHRVWDVVTFQSQHPFAAFGEVVYSGTAHAADADHDDIIAA